MASASSESDKSKRNYEEMENFVKTQKARISELENRLAKYDERMAEVERFTQESALEIERWKQLNPPKIPQIRKEQTTEDDSDDDTEVTAEQIYAQTSNDLSKSFAFCCHFLHGKMSAKMSVPWPPLLPLLRKEEMYFEGREWSGPLHLELAGHLEKCGLSTQDWDHSILRKNNGDPIYTPQEEKVVVTADVKRPVSRSSLSEEQISFMDRIVNFHRWSSKPLKRRAFQELQQDFQGHLQSSSEHTPEHRSKRIWIDPVFKARSEYHREIFWKYQVTPEKLSECTLDAIDYNPEFWKKYFISERMPVSPEPR